MVGECKGASFARCWKSIIPRRASGAGGVSGWVTSSFLCKKAEGVAQQLLRGLQVQPVPVLVESVKDGIEDSLHALHVGEQDHGPGAPANFHGFGSAPGVNSVVTGPTPLGFV
jgi:hypothetical protein